VKFGVVIHGPEVIDSGTARDVLDWLEARGQVIATLGGAMGLAALLDAGMEEEVTVVPRQLVSDALVAMDRESDVVILLNHAKSVDSGRAFGQMVVGRNLDRLAKPLVQIDDGFFIVWINGPLGPVAGLVKSMELEELPRPVIEEVEDDRRVLHDIRPGENIWINGTVIGKATSSEVVVYLKDGQLHFENVKVKAHGLEKVKIRDLRKAIIRSGSVRRTSSTARPASPSQGSRVILIDHRAEDSIFRARGARAAVTVGDDTTRIATSLLARLGVPVIGIVDGDEDVICLDNSAAEGSTTLVLYPGNDDQLGDRVRKEIFNGREETSWTESLNSLKDKIASMAGDKLARIIKN
jgi:hypothetical protein